MATLDDNSNFEVINIISSYYQFKKIFQIISTKQQNGNQVMRNKNNVNIDELTQKLIDLKVNDENKENNSRNVVNPGKENIISNYSLIPSPTNSPHSQRNHHQIKMY